MWLFINVIFAQNAYYNMRYLLNLTVYIQTTIIVITKNLKK